jgi:hypothetical protein
MWPRNQIWRVRPFLCPDKTQCAQFDVIAEEQSKRLVAAHERFSALMDKQRFQVVYPVLPMDLLGIYILLPEVTA